MIRIKSLALEIFKFNNLNQEEGIHHAITTRKGGISEGFADSLNLGYGVEDNVKYVEENRRRLAEFMQVPLEKLIFQRQTHSTNFKIITEKNFRDPVLNNDALITNVRGIAITTLGADCVPILLYDKKQKVVAAIHAGWKGTVNGITDKVMQCLKHEFGTNPIDIVAGIGPSICAKNYEVGPEVIDAFTQNFENHHDLISNRHGNKGHVDLWLANKTWLMRHGVPESQIEVSGICTFDEHDLFYSARYFKNQTGRFGSSIMLK